MFKKILTVAKKVLSGKNPVIVSQTKASWEKQYKEGKWDFLRETPENTAYIAYKIKDSLSTKKLSVLDVGCGNGGFLSLLRSVEEEFSYTGIDLSGEAISKLKKEFPSQHFLELDIEKEEFCVGLKFDVIVLSEILYYVNYKKVLSLLERYSHKETVVFISIYDSWRSFFLWRRIKKLIGVTYITKLGSAKRISWKIVEGYFK